MISDIKICGKKQKTNNKETKETINNSTKLNVKMFLTKTTPENASFDGIL